MTKPTALPRAGQGVRCPESKDRPAYQAVISSVGSSVYRHASGTAFCWVATKGLEGQRGVWPSDELGFVLPESVIKAGVIPPSVDAVKPVERLTRPVPGTDYYATAYRTGGGYFSTEGTPTTATALIELEPDADKRVQANQFFETLKKHAKITHDADTPSP